MEATAAAPRWSIFTHHGHVLLVLAAAPDARVRDIAKAVGITERTTQAILGDLRDAGYITSTAKGRRSFRLIVFGAELHHPAEAGLTVGEVLSVVKVRRPPSEPDSDRPRLVF